MMKMPKGIKAISVQYSSLFVLGFLHVSFVPASYLVRYWFGGGFREIEGVTKQSKSSIEEASVKSPFFCICSLWVFFMFDSYLLHTLFITSLVGVLLRAKEERRSYEGVVKGSGVEITVPALQPLFCTIFTAFLLVFFKTGLFVCQLLLPLQIFFCGLKLFF
jgi:hypothetical protein